MRIPIFLFRELSQRPEVSEFSCSCFGQSGTVRNQVPEGRLKMESVLWPVVSARVCVTSAFHNSNIGLKVI